MDNNGFVKRGIKDRHFMFFNAHQGYVCLIFIKRKEERGEKETLIWEIPTGCLPFMPNDDPICNLGMCPDWESHPATFWCTGQCSNQLNKPSGQG